MGNTYCMVENKCERDFWVVTFNHADSRCLVAHSQYFVAKSTVVKVECAPGKYIRVGIIYRINGSQQLCYQCWLVPSKDTVTVTKCDPRGDVMILDPESCHEYVGDKTIRAGVDEENFEEIRSCVRLQATSDKDL